MFFVVNVSSELHLTSGQSDKPLRVLTRRIKTSLWFQIDFHSDTLCPCQTSSSTSELTHTTIINLQTGFFLHFSPWTDHWSVSQTGVLGRSDWSQTRSLYSCGSRQTHTWIFFILADSDDLRCSSTQRQDKGLCTFGRFGFCSGFNFKM